MLHRFEHKETGLVGHEPEFVREALWKLRKKGFSFISLKDILEDLNGGKSIPPGSIAFTIDDGYWDHAEIAAPLFLEQQCPLTIFLITGFIDGISWPWDQRLAWLNSNTDPRSFQRLSCDYNLAINPIEPDSPRESFLSIRQYCKTLPGTEIEGLLLDAANKLGVEIPTSPPTAHRPMTWEQARLLESQGVDFSPHTVNHYSVSALARTEVEFELAESWARLKAELANPVKIIAWPTGQRSDINTQSRELAKDLGFPADATAQSNYCRLSGLRASPQLLHRFSWPDNITDVYQLATCFELLNFWGHTKITNQ